MKSRNVTPGKEKILERRLKDLRKTLRELEGTQERGFLDQYDHNADSRRIRSLREQIKEIEEELN